MERAIQDDYDGLLSPEIDGSSGKRATALSAKISSALSTSYADSEIREALRLFDLRRAQTNNNDSYGLKALAEKEVIDSNAQVIDDFGHVAAQLKRVGVLLSRLNETCDSMKLHILAAKQESSPVLEEASTLLERKKESQSKEKLLEAFRKHFILSDEDVTMLTSSAQPLTEQFYTILNRVKQIHQDCEVLLGQENQRLGLELMEQTTRHLDAAYKKLYNWIQREFKGIDLEDPHISVSIRRALRTLSERPTLFQNCLDFFAQARDTTLVESFQAALTGTSSTQAIEFSTHDPLRYVGDMLAWVHSATVSEKEALEGLFVSGTDDVSRGLSAGRNNEPWVRVTSQVGHRDLSSNGEEVVEEEEEYDGRKALANLIGRNMMSVCQTLRQRIDLATRNSGDAVLIYKVYNLLLFYDNIFEKLLGSETHLNVMLKELQKSTLDLFEVNMEQEISSSTTNTVPDPDLNPPPILQVILKQFTDICRSRGPQMNAQELERLFTTMLSRLLDACAESALQIVDRSAQNIYKANYFLMLRSSLQGTQSHVAHVSVPLERVVKELSTIRENLTSLLTTTLLDESGVNTLLQETDIRPEERDRREYFQENLAESAMVLDDFLASGLMDAQDAFAKLSDKAAAKEIVTDAVDRFCGEFDELEAMIDAADRVETSGSVDDGTDAYPATAGPSLRDLYPRTGGEVRALLS